MIKGDPLEVGDVVQIDPETDNCFFRGCFMLVTEVFGWGAQGFIAMPNSRDDMPGRAYYRATWNQMAFVGNAEWFPDDVSAGTDPSLEEATGSSPNPR